MPSNSFASSAEKPGCDGRGKDGLSEPPVSESLVLEALVSESLVAGTFLLGSFIIASIDSIVDAWIVRRQRTDTWQFAFDTSQLRVRKSWLDVPLHNVARKNA